MPILPSNVGLMMPLDAAAKKNSGPFHTGRCFRMSARHHPSCPRLPAVSGESRSVPIVDAGYWVPVLGAVVPPEPWFIIC